jgi:putative tricarboxylic transport membrane protein
MSDLYLGFTDAFALTTLAAVISGVLLGYLIGVIPGISRPTALAVAIPITFYLTPIAAVAFLVAISKASGAGGAITAILINTPGGPSSAAICLDGYPLSRQGKGEKALKISLYASVIGDILATAVLILIAEPIARIALRIGPIELVTILLFALTSIAALSGPSLTKGLIAGVLGLFLATVGLDIETATPRLTFGFIELYDGILVIAVVVGMLGMAEMLIQFGRHFAVSDANAAAAESAAGAPEDRAVSWTEFRRCLPTMLRGSGIGTVAGILPGLGATVASFLSYAAARRLSKNPDEFGKGALEGVAAAESADNATVPASLIPLFALGIPGSVGAALLIGAFTIHGITPGPWLFQENGPLVYGIFASMILTSFVVLIIGRVGLVGFARLAQVPQTVIVPVVVFLCIAGAYIESNSMFGVYVMFVFAALGYFFRAYGFSVVAFLIGFLIGPMFELALRQSIIIIRGDVTALLHHPFALIMLVVTAIAVWQLGRIQLSR